MSIIFFIKILKNGVYGSGGTELCIRTMKAGIFIV